MRVLHQDGRRTGHTQIFRRHRLAFAAGADHDPADALTQVFEAGSERQDCHQLRSHGDVIAGNARLALLVRSQADLDLAQEAVADVDDTVPGDAGGVDVQDSEAGALLGRQGVRIGLADAKLLEPAEHGGREAALTGLVWRAEAVEHHLGIHL